MIMVILSFPPTVIPCQPNLHYVLKESKVIELERIMSNWAFKCSL